MIDWPTIKATAAGLVRDLAAPNVVTVKWRDESEGSAWSTMPVIYLRIKDIGSIGWEEERREDTAGEDSTVTVTGQRKFTLSIRAESFTQDLADPGHAGSVIERIKTRMGRASSIETRNGIFGIVDDFDVKWFSYVSDGRQVDAYVLDLVCVTVDNDPDDTLDAGGWIGEVIHDGVVNNTDGSPLQAVHQDINAQ